MKSADEYIDDEWYVVRYSGEIPEIAFHSSLHYLCTDAEGPGFKLTNTQLKRLQEAASTRFREIVFRDLDHENSTTSGYRGIKRSIANFERYMNFCDRQQFDDPCIKEDVSGALKRFLLREDELVGDSGESIINCSYQELCGFCAKLGVDISEIPPRLTMFFPAQ